MSKLSELVSAAKVATPGPWHRADRTLTVYTVCGPDGLGIINADSPRTADYVALANPTTILELCDLLEKAEEALVWVDNCPRNFDRVRPTLAAIKQWKEQT